MKTRSVYIEDNLALSDAGTKSIDVATSAPISAIELLFGATKGATENQSDKIQDYITKIELVDGADFLWSLSMTEAIALNCFERRRKPFHEYDLSGSGTPQESCWLNFGRYLFDPEYYLDEAKYANLQLKITTNMTAAAGTYVTATITVDIVAHIIEEGAEPHQGFFSAKEIYSWTTTASGVDTVDMPRDFPYRMLLVGAGEANVPITTDVTNIKLSGDEDRFVVFDFATADLLLRNMTEFGDFEELIKSTMQDADTLDSSLWYVKGAAMMGGDEDFGCRLASASGNRMTFSFFDQT